MNGVNGVQRPPGPGYTLVVGEPVLGTRPGGDATYRVELRLERPHGRPYLLHGVEVSSSHPIDVASGAGSPGLVLALMPAMALGVPVRVEAPVSPRLLAGLPLVQRVFASWFPHLAPVEVEAPAAPPRPPSARGTAAFFSAGVDGFHTVKRHLGDLDQLVFLHGFDIDLERVEHRVAIEAFVGRIADDLGTELVVMQTDARSMGDDYAPWHAFCGPVLAACAQLLEAVADRVLVASSNSHAEFLYFGTNALTDPHLSTEGVEVVYDHGELTRIEKVRELAEWDYALAHLRVCWAMEDSSLNCCRCDKCMRTMTALWLAGALDRASTFPEPLDPARIGAFDFDHEHACFVEENLALAAQLGLGRHPIAEAWRRSVATTEAAAAPVTVEGLRAAAHADPLLGVWAPRHAVPLFHGLAHVARDELHDWLAHYQPAVLDEVVAHGEATLGRTPVLARARDVARVRTRARHAAAAARARLDARR